MQSFEDEGAADNQKLRDLLKPVRLEYQKRHLAAFSDGKSPCAVQPTKTFKERARYRLLSTIRNFNKSLRSEDASIIKAVMLDVDQTNNSLEISDEFLSQQNVDINALEESADPSERFRAVQLRSAQGLLTGLTSSGTWQGCLAIEPGFAQGPERCICKKCLGGLKEKVLPAEALINGTWQGLIPIELQGLNNIEKSMIPVYNAITIMGHFQGGMLDFI